MSFDVALQLYTVRDALAGDFIGGLAKVADMGYRHVEFAGFGGHTASEIAQALNDLQMQASGAHVPVSILDDDSKLIDELKTINCKHATIPWLPEELRASWPNIARRMNDFATSIAKRDIALGYHNHAMEFEENGFSQLIEHAPDLNIQLDVYWAAKAGEDPVEWIDRLAGRLPSIHCKDLGADGHDIELGEGVLDWKAILEAAERAGVRTLVIEMDTPRLEPMASAAKCLKGLQRYL